MNKLAILGASGHGYVTAEIAEQLGWDCIEFYDAAWSELNKDVASWCLVGDETAFWNHLNDYDGVFIAIGNNKIRAEKIIRLKNLNVKVINLIAPSAVISSRTKLGQGILVAGLVCININSNLGDGVIVNTGATIDHECIIEDYVHISPGVNIAGNVSIGEFSWLGIGSSVIHNIRIDKEVITGAGSVIINDIPKGVTIAGVPAYIINQQK